MSEVEISIDNTMTTIIWNVEHHRIQKQFTSHTNYSTSAHFDLTHSSHLQTKIAT